MLGLYLYDTLWLCIDSSGININPLRYWTFSLSLIDLGLIMGSQVDNSSNNHNPSCENLHVHVLGKQIYIS